MNMLIDRTGERFGRLTVIERAPNSPKYPGTRWLCQCDCGNAKVIQVGHLRTGLTKSCGCLRAELLTVARPGYDGAHSRVARIRGRAKDHACVDCSAPATAWSYDHTCPNELTERVPPRRRPGAAVLVRYSADPSRYSPRCNACHSSFDRRVAQSL